ncbi:hypothetical protein C8R46DRAFT_1042091 [Mycena filopes]|nr:hypothetical protein C8R46DRAFT_1042091 [Mycena filopes]
MITNIEHDDIEPRKRGNHGDSGGVMDRMVSQLLAELDGMPGGSGADALEPFAARDANAVEHILGSRGHIYTGRIGIRQCRAGKRKEGETARTMKVVDNLKRDTRGGFAAVVAADIDTDRAPATRSAGQVESVRRCLGRKNEGIEEVVHADEAVHTGKALQYSSRPIWAGGAGSCPDARRMGHRNHAGRRTKAVNHEFRDSVTGGSNLVVSAIQPIYREVGASHSWGTRERPRMRLGVERVAILWMSEWSSSGETLRNAKYRPCLLESDDPDLGTRLRPETLPHRSASCK